MSSVDGTMRSQAGDAMTEFGDVLSSLRDQLPKVLRLGILVLVVTVDLVFALLRVVPAERDQEHHTLPLGVGR